MDEQKKKVILGEIDYWRRSHLLPAHYCDFLLNLYTEGAKDDTSASKSIVEAAASADSLPAFAFPRFEKKWLAIIPAVAVVLYLAFHFTDFTMTMQMAILAILTAVSYILAFVGDKSSIYRHIFLGTASVMLAVSGMYILNHYKYGVFYLISYLTLCCVIWLATGIAANKRYISFIALLGLQGIYGWLTYFKLVGGFSWWRVECFWLSVGIALVVLGMIWNKRQSGTAPLLFFNGILALYAPEIESFFISSAGRDTLLYLLYGKIFVVTFFMLSLKNLWWPWVSSQRALK
ncbi:hypothetical protein PP175_19230 [Aneurinibacillus sp. Ricciae_BoGa-3]|uniref:hypothetical protein n=1 Tax=Aneurinibacillus sp. Ricciae_BoGa-3 TaxID=3022697 RepID=UPI00233FD4AD|nr:hypothetical protein [Aneurinibacillus sp. Ricciae_BoGa-3]WCK53454.1 hypothetical protein PP175_19230 [Aneurinibacillus sp. Ricciae_BoGa-3]